MSHSANVPNLTALFAVPPPPIDGQKLIDGFIIRKQLQSLNVDQSGVKNHRKRKRRTVKRNSPSESTEEKIAKRQQLHDSIDAWRKEKHDQLLNEKDQARNKKSLKDILIQIKEGVEMVQKLKRTLASPDSQEPEAIEKCNRLIELWRDALHENLAEKTRLEGILGAGVVDDVAPKETAQDYPLFKCLFGDSFTGVASLKPPNFQEFIRIRSGWDQFVSDEEGSTGIPPFYSHPSVNHDKLSN